MYFYVGQQDDRSPLFALCSLVLLTISVLFLVHFIEKNTFPLVISLELTVFSFLLFCGNVNEFIYFVSWRKKKGNLKFASVNVTTLFAAQMHRLSYSLWYKRLLKYAIRASNGN